MVLQGHGLLQPGYGRRPELGLRLLTCGVLQPLCLEVRPEDQEGVGAGPLPQRRQVRAPKQSFFISLSINVYFWFS